MRGSRRKNMVNLNKSPSGKLRAVSTQEAVRPRGEAPDFLAADWMTRVCRFFRQRAARYEAPFPVDHTQRHNAASFDGGAKRPIGSSPVSIS